MVIVLVNVSVNGKRKSTQTIIERLMSDGRKVYNKALFNISSTGG